MIRVYIDGIDRSELIQMGSISILDQINQGADTATFTIQKYGSREFVPTVNSEIIIELVTEEPVRIYGGVVVEVTNSLEGHAIVNYDVKCRDFTHYMDRLLVTERYEDTTLQAVVQDLVYVYGNDYGFTSDAVLGSMVSIASVAFNEIKLSDCFNKLARLTGYSWYVDYQKDVHFFKKNEELAPFDLTDTSENYVFDSLVVVDDFSQIRNRVRVTGGEGRAEERTEKKTGDGETDTFPTGNKFAELPTIEVDGSPVTVGVDYLQKDADFDVMWNFEQKYIRFTAGNIPGAPLSGTTNIEITGIPLKPIVVQRSDSTSIALYGVYEHSIKNDSLKTRDEALQFALADLQAYADKVRGGSFETYEPGLKSGQTISVNSTMRAIAEVFLIQSVKFEQLTSGLFLWRVEMATIKTLSLIDILQNLLLQERISIGEDETLLNFFDFTDNFTMTDTLDAIVVTDTQDYVVEQNTPGSDSYPNPAIVNKSTMSA